MRLRSPSAPLRQSCPAYLRVRPPAPCVVAWSDRPFLPPVSPLRSSATNRLIEAKDKASVQINIGHVNADGVYTGEYTTMALCGFIRGMGEADGAFDRLWTKSYEASKGSI